MIMKSLKEKGASSMIFLKIYSKKTDRLILKNSRMRYRIWKVFIIRWLRHIMQYFLILTFNCGRVHLQNRAQRAYWIRSGYIEWTINICQWKLNFNLTKQNGDVHIIPKFQFHRLYHRLWSKDIHKLYINICGPVITNFHLKWLYRSF